MRYRSAEVSDAANISELIYSTSLACCFTSEQPCPSWFEESVSQPVIESHITARSVSYLVAERENKIVGVLGIAGGNSVKYFFVHPDHQGVGIGAQLWRLAGSQGLFGRTISVRASLVAVPVYERLGFLAVEPPQVFNGLHYQSMAATYG